MPHKTIEQRRDYHRRWVAAHPGKQAEYESRRKPRTKEQIARGYAVTKVWRHTNAIRVKEWNRFQNARTRDTAIEVLGGACVHCWCMDRRLLQIDHKHNDGAIERQTIRAKSLYGKIARREVDLSRYQLLCGNCHALKSWRGFFTLNKGYSYETQ